MLQSLDKKFILCLMVFVFTVLCGRITAANEYIAFSRLTNNYWQIWIMSEDGMNQKQLTFSSEDKRSPVYVAQQKRIGYRNSNGELFTIDLNGDDQKQLLTKFGVINSPDFAHKSDLVVFARFDPRAADVSDIWLTDLKTGTPNLLTKDKQLKYQPKFSLNDDKITYIKNKKNSVYSNIWIMNADGTNHHQLTDGDSIDMYPSFSPDGKFVIYSSKNDSGNYDIFIADVDKRSKEKVIVNPAVDISASYSPDGKNIVFVSDRSGRKQIWVINREDQSLNQLTEAEEESIDPVWFYVKEDDNV